MIRIDRGPEPDSLPALRAGQLARLRALKREMGRDPLSDEIQGYRIAAETLWQAQHKKCCYCEQKIYKNFNDVDHYRPKASANRLPGCLKRHGYWWLAFHWDNLLFACPICNRMFKNALFPLQEGSTSLLAEQPPPGKERPLLLDPGAANTNPVEHIVFVLDAVGASKHWWARPRHGSQFGARTIEACGLNDWQHREMRRDHFENHVEPLRAALAAALAAKRRNRSDIHSAFEQALALLKPRMPYVAFTYDALCASIPDAQLQKTIKRTWPAPGQVGMPGQAAPEQAPIMAA